MSEWSNETDLRSVMFACVGSNPTGFISVNFKLIFSLKFINLFLHTYILLKV